MSEERNTPGFLELKVSPLRVLAGLTAPIWGPPKYFAPLFASYINCETETSEYTQRVKDSAIH